MIPGNDLVVRGGLIVDGTGSLPIVDDIAIADGKIVAIGESLGRGSTEIDARGKVVTPGFIDIHTHYDGQAVWSDRLWPSTQHGVTTLLFGNCGVGFAPCRPEDRTTLIDLMEGVEDIPAPVLHEGLNWEWESFEQYLDVLDRRGRDADVCALLPHAPLRIYTMGQRGVNREPATAEDLVRMRELVSAAIAAGAFGVSTSRNKNHHSRAGESIATLKAEWSEISALLDGIAAAGSGIFQIVTDTASDSLLAQLRTLAHELEVSGVPALYTVVQNKEHEHLWRDLLSLALECREKGVSMRPMVAPRAVGIVLGLESTHHPYVGTRTYRSIADLPLAERVARMRQPEMRDAILTDDPFEFAPAQILRILRRITYSDMYPLGEPPNYLPTADESIEGIARRESRKPGEVLYDALIEDDGAGFVYVPLSNYANNSLETVSEMLSHPCSVMALGDGGAHVGLILDANFQTFMLSFWVRDSGHFTIQEGVRRMTSDTAHILGLNDRGRLAVGLKADLNVIDLDRLSVGRPYLAHDLPLGGSRLLQRVEGYDATILSGVVTYEHGIHTGATPGRLVRAAPV